MSKITDNFLKKRRRASQSTRIRLKKSEILDIQLNDNCEQLHENYYQLTKSRSNVNRRNMYKEKNKTKWNSQKCNNIKVVLKHHETNDSKPIVLCKFNSPF